MTQQEVQYEAKHIIHVPSSTDDFGDALIVKENIHHPNGDIEPNLRTIRNFKRDWYLTREGHRNHPLKKGSEELVKLMRRQSNDRAMPRDICRALKKNTFNLNMKRISRTPYLYGSDISGATILKKKYQDRFPDAVSSSTIAVLDIETDVRSHPLPDKQEIIYIGLTMKDKAFLCYTDKFMEGVADVDAKLQEAFEKYLGHKKKARNIKLETKRVANPGEAVYETIQRAHQWMPDFLVVYNLDFDMSVMLRMCDKYGYDVSHVFSDPRIPPDLRSVTYSRGAAKRVSSSGKVLSFNPWERWHTMLAPASFYPICAMSSYAFIRKAEGNELSYKLDYILEKNIGERKLNFPFADHITDQTEWHFFMQKHHKIEYGIYCLYDCIGVEELDESTSDLNTTIPELTGFSEYQNFDSTPKQLADDLHFFYLDKRKSAIASTSDQMRTEDDDLVVTMDGWIVTLATHLVEDNGLRLIKGMPEQPTLYRGHVSDLDLRSAYPWGEITMNVGKETTTYEICRIEGLSNADQRMLGLNITGGATNAVEYCRVMHRLPSFEQICDEIRSMKSQPAPSREPELETTRTSLLF